MKKILLLNAIVEMTGGILVMLYPQIIFIDTPLDDLSFNLSKMYGILAAVFGLLSFLIYKHAQSRILIKYVCLSILAFHLFLCFHLYGIFKIKLIGHFGPAAFHLAIFIISGILYLRSLEKKEAQ